MPITEKQHYGFLDLLKYGGSAQSGGAQQGVVGGQCTDHQGLLGEKGAKVSCADLKSAQEGKSAGAYRSYTSFADEPDTGKKTSKSGADGIKSGNYEENDYIYRYDAKTGNITIVASPSGPTNTAVPKGGSAYKAIIGVIQSGKAKPVSASAVKKTVASKPPAPVSSADILKGAEMATKTPFYKETWFLIGAPITVAVLIGVAIIFWPSGDDE